VAKIDRLKAKRDQQEEMEDPYSTGSNAKGNLVDEVFGGYNTGMRFDWFLPTRPVFPVSLIEDIYGYSQPITVGNWTAVVDASGDTYYWNSVTNETSWDVPSGFHSSDNV
jgi:hypothetical protein